MAELHLKDGATWREPSELWAKDGATWRKASQMWIKNGATWRLSYTGILASATIGVEYFFQAGKPDTSFIGYSEVNTAYNRWNFTIPSTLGTISPDPTTVNGATIKAIVKLIAGVNVVLSGNRALSFFDTCSASGYTGVTSSNCTVTYHSDLDETVFYFDILSPLESVTFTDGTNLTFEFT